MESVGFVDDLKITASYAKLHQDLDISDYYMYKGYFLTKAVGFNGMTERWVVIRPVQNEVTIRILTLSLVRKFVQV